MAVTDTRSGERQSYILGAWIERVSIFYWALALVLIILPLFLGGFLLSGFFARIFILGMIALSLTFLAGYGGMVSLIQMTIAGLAGYMVAIFGVSQITDLSLGWPWYVAVPLALIVSVLFATLTGWISVRTEGIYTIMITLAIASAFYYFTLQNYEIFGGQQGINGVIPPKLFGVDWTEHTPYYYLSLFWATVSFFVVLYVSRAPFGLALQGTRDNARRMAALGFNVTAHRVAAYAFAAVIAAIGGLLLVWDNGNIDPERAAIGPVINILIIAVIGGLRHPIGPFIGAVIFVTLETFAPEILSAFGLPRERKDLLIGLVFVAIVFWSSDGILGLWDRWKENWGRDPLTGERRGEQ